MAMHGVSAKVLLLQLGAIATTIYHKALIGMSHPAMNKKIR